MIIIWIYGSSWYYDGSVLHYTLLDASHVQRSGLGGLPFGIGRTSFQILVRIPGEDLSVLAASMMMVMG